MARIHDIIFTFQKLSLNGKKKKNLIKKLQKILIKDPNLNPTTKTSITIPSQKQLNQNLNGKNPNKKADNTITNKYQTKNNHEILELKKKSMERKNSNKIQLQKI